MQTVTKATGFTLTRDEWEELENAEGEEVELGGFTGKAYALYNEDDEANGVVVYFEGIAVSDLTD
jgi:hypothetical protein